MSDLRETNKKITNTVAKVYGSLGVAVVIGCGALICKELAEPTSSSYISLTLSSAGAVVGSCFSAIAIKMHYDNRQNS